MHKISQVTFLIFAVGSLAACAGGYSSNRPGELVNTNTFISNVLEEHGVIRRQNTQPIPGSNSDVELSSS